MTITNIRPGERIKVASRGVTPTELDAALAAIVIETANIADDSITAGKIAAGAVGESELASNAVTANKIAALAVTTAKLDDGAVTTTKLGANSVGTTALNVDAVATENIQALAVTGPKIDTGAVTASKIGDEAVTVGRIGPLAVTTEKIATGAVTASKIGDEAVTVGRIGPLAVTTEKIDTGAVTASKIGDEAVTTGRIGPLAVTTEKINTGAVTASKIGDLAVTTGRIGDLAVTEAKLADESVATAKLQLGAVTGARISDGAVTFDKLGTEAVIEAKLANLAVTTAKIATGAVTASKIGDEAVTTGRIGDLAVTEAKLADESVATAKIQLGAITGARISDGAVSLGKIGTSAVAEANIGSNAVTTAKLNDGAVTADKLATHAVTQTKIGVGAITTDRLADFLITEDKIFSSAVTRNKIAVDSINTVRIEDLAVTTAKIANSAVTRNQIAVDTINTVRIEDIAVTEAKIANAAVTRNKIAVDSINTVRIEDGAVTVDKLSIDLKAYESGLEVRPGNRPYLFTETLLGTFEDTDPLSGIPTAHDTDGKALRVTAAHIVASRRVFRIEPGHVYKARAVVRRRINPADPSNDAVALRIQWLDMTQTVDRGTTIVLNENELLTAHGRYELSGIIAKDAGDDIDHVAPALAIYGRAYVQTFGLAQTDVELIQVTDITDASIVDTGDAALNARITAIETETLPVRLEVVEAFVAGSQIARFKTRAAAVAAAAGADIPASTDIVEVLSLADDDDGIFATYVRAVTDSGDDSFEDDDGTFWVRVPEKVISTRGPTPRSFQERAADNPNFEDWRRNIAGALLGDTEMAQAAMTAMLESGGGTINMLPETYELEDTLIIPQGVKIRGSGARYYQLYSSTDFTVIGSCFKLAAGANTDLLIARYVPFGTEPIPVGHPDTTRHEGGLYRIAIWGNRSDNQSPLVRDTNTSGMGIRIQGSSGFTLDDVLVLRCAEEGIRVESYDYGLGALSSNNMHWKTWKSLGNYGDGAGLYGADSNHGFGVTGYNGEKGVISTAGNANLQLQTWNNYQANLYHSTGEDAHFHILSYDGQLQGAAFSDCEGCSISGNIHGNGCDTGALLSNRSGIWLGADVVDLLINCTIEADGASGITQQYGIFDFTGTAQATIYGHVGAHPISRLSGFDYDANVRVHPNFGGNRPLHPGFTAEGAIDLNSNPLMNVSGLSGNLWATATFATGTLTCGGAWLLTANIAGNVTVTDITSAQTGIPIVVIRNIHATDTLTFDHNVLKLRLLGGADIVLAQYEAITFAFVSGTIWQQIAGKV